VAGAGAGAVYAIGVVDECDSPIEGNRRHVALETFVAFFKLADGSNIERQALLSFGRWF
jgi:hypothetical protein